MSQLTSATSPRATDAEHQSVSHASPQTPLREQQTPEKIWSAGAEERPVRVSSCGTRTPLRLSLERFFTSDLPLWSCLAEAGRFISSMNNASVYTLIWDSFFSAFDRSETRLKT